MATAIEAAEEAARLNELWSFDILNTEPEPQYDDLVQLMATLCDAPIAALSLVDCDRLWFKAKVGLPACEVNREGAFCDVVVASRRPLLIGDATRDSRFSECPLVRGPLGVRAYLGHPIETQAGAVVGSLCAVDVQPRTWTDLQIQILRVHAAQVTALLELRRATAELTRLWEERRDIESRALTGRRDDQRRLSAALHDGLGQDLTGMSLLLKVVRERSAESHTAAELHKIERLMRNAIDTCRSLARGQTVFGFVHGSLRESLEQYLAGIAELSGMQCELQWEQTVALYDRAAAYNVFLIAQQAVTNALRHSCARHIQVCVSMQDGRLRLDVDDDGDGLHADDLPSHGVGFETIRYRAGALGGSFGLMSREPRGLRMRCEIPLVRPTIPRPSR